VRSKEYPVGRNLEGTTRIAFTEQDGGAGFFFDERPKSCTPAEVLEKVQEPTRCGKISLPLTDEND